MLLLFLVNDCFCLYLLSLITWWDYQRVHYCWIDITIACSWWELWTRTNLVAKRKSYWGPRNKFVFYFACFQNSVINHSSFWEFKLWLKMKLVSCSLWGQLAQMEGKHESTDPKTETSIRGNVCAGVHGCYSKNHPRPTEKVKLTGALTPSEDGFVRWT